MNASQWHWMAILFIFHTQISCFHVAASLTLNSTSDEFTISDKDYFQQGIPLKNGESEFTDSKVKKHESIKNRELNDLQGSCTFNAMPLNLQNQFETDLIENAIEGAFAQGREYASEKNPAVEPILSSFVFPLAEAVTAGQISARYATDPNEDRFTALENFASCITKEFDLVWKRLEELAVRMHNHDIKQQRIFFQINVQKLQDQKNVLFVNYMKDVNHCLLSDGSKFLNSGSECGKDKIVDLTSDFFEHVVKDFGAVLDAAAILYKDTGVAGNNPDSKPYTPMFGYRIEIDSFPSGDTAHNDGFGGIYVPKLDYTDMRIFLSEITYQANTNTLILAQVREWATARELYRNPYVLDFVWDRIIKTAEDISKSLQSLIDSLMYSSEKTGNLPVQRILTSDTLDDRVFCIDGLKLKSNAPDWCKNKDPFGWIWDEHMPKRIGYPTCDDSYSRGCWIGDGECSLNNFKDICIDLSESIVDKNDDYSHMCALNEVPQLPVDNNTYDDIGPMAWAYVHGAPVDPLINNINKMREAVAYTNAFVSYWKKEEQILRKEIKIGCNGQSKETLGPSNYSFDACPRPSSCITCSGTQGSECAYETITDAEKCGTYTVLNKRRNGCCSLYKKEIYYNDKECNAYQCGSERVKVGEKCGGFCCCIKKYPVYETRAKCCKTRHTRWVADTCTFPKTCIVADECTCRTKECDGESFDITTGQEK